MKLEIKNVRVQEKLSDETLCFSATLYVDGKRAATVSNRGCGGCHNYHWLDYKNVGQKVEEWAKQQPLEFDFDHLDQIVDDLLKKWEDAKLCRNKTVFHLKSRPKQEMCVIKEKFSSNLKTWIERKYGDDLDYILNERL